MVHLRRRSKVYDNDCNIDGYATDIAGVHITPAKGKIKLPQVSEASVKYNAHIQVQLDYINAEVMRKLNNRYKISIVFMFMFMLLSRNGTCRYSCFRAQRAPSFYLT